MMALRRSIMLSKKIQVVWNQQAYPINSDNWRAYSSTNISVTFNDGIATLLWLTNNGGSLGSLWGTSDAQRYHPVIGEKWYGGYMLNPSFGTGRWSIEICNSINPFRLSADANVWSRLGVITIAANQQAKGYHMLIPSLRNIDANQKDGTCMVKCPVLVNLTQMYGAGNEPEVSEFERQCSVNGIDLTTALPYNSGELRIWNL